MKRSLSFAALLFASSVFGGTTGSLTGLIRNGEGEPLPDVRVAVRSASLQGERTTSSGTDGRFRILALPPGNYDVVAIRQGFQSVRQSAVVVPIDREITLEFKLVRMFSEEVTVAGSRPLLDVTSPAISTIVERETFETLPAARTYLDLAFLAPGVVAGSSMRTRPSIAGASGSENRFVVDGLDTTDTGFGMLESALPPEFLQIVEIKTGGLGAEYGGALGGVINVLTRSGSNEHQAAVFGYYTNSGFASDPRSSVQNPQFLGSTTYDYGATLGGAIVRDRVWYFLGVDPRIDHHHWVTSQNIRVIDPSDGKSYIGKVSWQLDAKQRLVASAFGDPSRSTGTALANVGLLRGTNETASRHRAFSYDGIAGRDLLLEGFAGRYQQDATLSPAADRPWYTDFTNGKWAAKENCGDPSLIANGMSFAPGCLGGTFVYDALNSRRDEIRSSIAWHAQTGTLSHDLKTGATFRHVSYDFRVHYPAPAPGPFYDSAGTLVSAAGLSGQQWNLRGAFARLHDFSQGGPGKNEEKAIFVQDEIRIGNRWTLLSGLRAEAFDSTGTKTAEDKNARLKFGLKDMLGPRAGIAWDPIGRGQSKFFAHFARSYESVPLYLNTFILGSQSDNYYFFKYPENGALPSARNPGVLISKTVSQAAFKVAPNLRAEHNDEVLFGFASQLGRDVSAGLTAVRRQVGDVIEDFSIDDGQTFILGNPGGTMTTDPVTGAALDRPITFEKPARKYRALQLTVERRLRGNWQLAGSYVYSRTEGNYGGLANQANFTSDYDLPELGHNASGLLSNDRTHQAKLYGSLHSSLGVTAGIFVQYLSGTPVSKIGYHDFYGPVRFITPRGSAGRTPATAPLDLHAEYAAPLHSRGVTVSLFADLFNSMNQQKAIAVDEVWTYATARQTTDANECGGRGSGPGTACPDGNPNWGQPLLFQEPRTIRIGAKLNW